MTDVASTTMPDWDDPMAPSGDRRGVRGRPDWSDLLYFVVLSVAAAYCLYAYHGRMDVYEQGILLGIVPLLAWMGWLWRPLRSVTIVSCMVAVFAIWLYSPTGQFSVGDIGRADEVFFLKYLISSQSALLWICGLFLLAAGGSLVGLAGPQRCSVGSGLRWA